MIIEAYACDNCKKRIQKAKDVNDDSWIRVAPVMMCFPVRIEVRRGSSQVVNEFKMPVHFCNCKCFVEYITKEHKYTRPKE